MLWAGQGRCPEEQPISSYEQWHLGPRHHIKQRTGVTVLESHDPPLSGSGSAKNWPPTSEEEAGGARSGFAVTIPSLLAKCRQVVFSEHRTHYYFKRGFWNQEAGCIYEISSYFFPEMVIIQFISFATGLNVKH